MAISQVRVKVNGTWHTMTAGSNNTYTATITAPGTTSFNLNPQYYNCEVEVTNTAGTVVTADGSDLSGLRLVVKETVKPVITFTSPTSGAYVINNRQPVVFTVTDESGGSGVKLSTLVIKVDGTTQASSTYTTTAITNGYRVTFTPASALSDGSHTVTVDCSDNDGNAAVQKTLTFTVDTVPPTLNITAPVDNIVTNTASINVVGTTNDATSSPVTISITVTGSGSGQSQTYTPTVSSAGAFTQAVTLYEGTNTISITATDSAGKTSTVSRTATLDTTSPQITLATINPNPANTEQSVIITVTVLPSGG